MHPNTTTPPGAVKMTPPTPKSQLPRLREVSTLTLRAFVYTVIGLLLSTQTAYAVETVTYYHHDALGSPVAATDEGGNLLWREDYQPYGERIRKPTNTDNTLWYTGKPEEPDLGLQYFGARWYDPQLGRFTGIDPVGFREDNIHSFNRYAYANNNPYRFIDPDGRVPDEFEGDNDSQGFAGSGGNTISPQAKQNMAILYGGGLAAVACASGGCAAGAAFAFTRAPTITTFSTEILAGEVGLGVGGVSGFKNLRPTDAIGDAITFTSSQIQKVSYSGRLNYIVSKTGELVIGRTGHTSLSQGADVLAAGEVKFVDGVLKSLNNASGHYQPKGASARETAETAFEKVGFAATDKYQEKF